MLHRLRAYLFAGATALFFNCGPVQAFSCLPGPFVIFFDADDAYVDKQGMETMGYARDIARECSMRTLLLEGHSDTLENAAIARKRLEVVRTYFVSHGIPRDDISTKFYGSKQQRIATGPRISERQNRRVVVNFIPSF